MLEPYLRNVWYQAAWSSELEAGPLARTILDTPILIYRTADGIAALLDRCPHRFAPLSAGRIENGVAVCGYHGLGYDSSGKCVLNPHSAITSAMRVESYAAVERHTAIWIWMGEASAADPARIPDLSFIDRTPETARIELYMYTAAGYRLLTDNIMDLSHADYLHPSSLGGMMMHTKARTFERDGRLVAEWASPSCPAPPMFQSKVTSPQMSNYWIEVAWEAPAVMVLGTAVVPEGSERTPVDEVYALHNMTPETDGTCHYFMCATRGDRLNDANFSAMLKVRLEHAFSGEDKPMIEAQQRRMGSDDLWALKPILLPTDAAAVQVRRRLDQLIASEQAASSKNN